MLINTLAKAALPFLLIFQSIAFAQPTASTPTQSPIGGQLYDTYPWMLTYYYGVTSDTSLIPLATGHYKHWPESIQSIELARTLDADNWFRRFISPLVGVVQLAGNLTVRQGRAEHTIYEVDPYIAFRWANFPWNDYVVTSLAFGEGVSYASSVPSVEKKHNENTKRFLNYLMFEATFAAPNYPQLQFITRIHHRSGAFGLYRAGNTGSNVIGVGVRYLFD